jgi:hypothetical protein
MNANEMKLGTIPQGDEGRDAVHIAIVPVQAADPLISGTPARLNHLNKAEACDVSDAIGIVDPFRPHDHFLVARGEWFWLCLYPKTITGLRHVWEHPSFPLSSAEAPPPPPADKTQKETSEIWLREYVTRWSPYDLYENFINRVKVDRHLHFSGHDCHCWEDVEDRDELFYHLSVVLECRVDIAYFVGYSCSC